jgi:hypothetical protein
MEKLRITRTVRQAAGPFEQGLGMLFSDAAHEPEGEIGAEASAPGAQAFRRAPRKVSARFRPPVSSDQGATGQA